MPDDRVRPQGASSSSKFSANELGSRVASVTSLPVTSKVPNNLSPSAWCASRLTLQSVTVTQPMAVAGRPELHLTDAVKAAGQMHHLVVVEGVDLLAGLALELERAYTAFDDERERQILFLGQLYAVERGWLCGFQIAGFDEAAAGQQCQALRGARWIASRP